MTRQNRHPGGRGGGGVVEVLLALPSLAQSEVRELLTLDKVLYSHILHSVCSKYRFFSFLFFPTRYLARMSRRTIKSATGAWRGKPIACYSTLSITLLRYLFSYSLVSTLQYPVLHGLSSPNIVALLSLVFHIFASSFKSFALEMTSETIVWTKCTPHVNCKARHSFRKAGII